MNANSSAVNNHTVGEWLATNTKLLEQAGIRSARLDCFILLEQRLPHDRAKILAHLDAELTDEIRKQLDSDIQLRLQHIPTQYIIGYGEFYGRQFIVSPDVLVPRPESESLISLLKTLPTPATIVDVGTGSGCLAVTAKLEHPDSRVIGLDIAERALSVARQNADKHTAAVEFVHSDLLASLPATEAPTILLANLPYVPQSMTINEPAKHEPTIALFSGADGLDAYRTMWQQITTLPTQPTAVLCESLESQHHSLAVIARAAGYSLEQTDGLAQVFLR